MSPAPTDVICYINASVAAELFNFLKRERGQTCLFLFLSLSHANLLSVTSMKRPRSLNASLEHLSACSEQVEKTGAVQILRGALAAKLHSIVAKAAGLVGKLKLDELIPDLCSAFDRFMGNGMSSDKSCLAKTAIVEALHQLGSDQPAVFLLGMRCYWPERPWADQRDEAADLRIAAAKAHAELGRRSELGPLVDLLVDPVSDVRHMAVRALAAMGGEQGAPVLRLKTRIGDSNVSVIEACFAGLLEVDGDQYVPFVAEFLDSADDRKQVAAAIALGDSGHTRAFDALASCFKRTHDSDFQRDLLVAISLLRNDQAVQFLLCLIESGKGHARDALVTLAIYKSNPQRRHQVEEAVDRAGTAELRRLFDDKFGKP